MPTVNSRGHIIPDADPEVIEAARKLRELTWPDDRDKIAALHCRAFFSWLYGVEPRLAVQFAYSPDFQKILKRKRFKLSIANFFWRIVEKIWR